MLDSDNQPHIAYTGLRINSDRSSTPLVMYASWNGTGFNTQQIAEGLAFSLALDTKSNPYILYSSGGTNRAFGPLKYASWTGSQWDTQIVDENFLFGHGVVSLDSTGNPQVVYTNGTTVKYASLSGSTWIFQTVDSNLDISERLSFKLDSQNNPYILYSTESSYVDSTGTSHYAVEVKLAKEKSTEWNIENISLPPSIYTLGNMVLDSKNNPRFIFTQKEYNSEILDTLMFASWDGANWRTKNLVSGANLAIGSLALDSHDNPFISYYLNNEPMCASWTGANWNIQTAPISGYSAIDSHGNPHISYLGLPKEKLSSPRIAYTMYATATQTASPMQSLPTVEDLPLLLCLTAVLVAAGLTLVYIWKRKQ